MKFFVLESCLAHLFIITSIWPLGWKIHGSLHFNLTVAWLIYHYRLSDGLLQVNSARECSRVRGGSTTASCGTRWSRKWRRPAGIRSHVGRPSLPRTTGALLTFGGEYFCSLCPKSFFSWGSFELSYFFLESRKKAWNLIFWSCLKKRKLSHRTWNFFYHIY